MNTLVLSTGGSIEPLIHCIEQENPDRVVFLCSKGSRNKVDEILQRLPLHNFQSERDVVVLDQRLGRKDAPETSNELDLLDAVYEKARDALRRIRQEDPSTRLAVDYTGGTKTMAAGLALAALDDPQVDQLLLTTAAKRVAGEQTISGFSKPVPVARGRVHRRRLLESLLPDPLERYDYVAAKEAISGVRSLLSSDPACQDILRLESALLAFDAWDRFDHGRAQLILQDLMDQPWLHPWSRTLNRVIGSRQWLDDQEQVSEWRAEKSHGLEVVEDLLRNAERRARQQHYDDAVGRLYRAMELTAQLLLRFGVGDRLQGEGASEGLLTGAIAIDLLPPDLQPIYLEKQRQRGGDGPLQLALRESYELLDALGHPTGERWGSEKERILDALSRRNHSLFAHGFRPITYADWRDLDTTLGGFIRRSIEEEASKRKLAYAVMPQFPSSLQEMGYS